MITQITGRQFFACLGILLSFVGCQVEDFKAKLGDEGTEVVVKTEINPESAVCDPFGGQSHLSADHGVKGKLRYLADDIRDGQRSYQRLQDYWDYGIETPETLFFSQLNIPTRLFNRGFYRGDGRLLETPRGDTLYEFFMIHFETEIKLAPGQASGRYQFAILSDDGSIMEIKDSNAGFRTLINNDQYHPTRLGCAVTTVEMNADSHFPVKLDYFQGPRTHIALMLLWREVPVSEYDDARWLIDPECGSTGNGYFFDYRETPSRPTDKYLRMLDRGWRVVGAENFYIPQDIAANPCTQNPSPEPDPNQPCGGVSCGGGY